VSCCSRFNETPFLSARRPGLIGALVDDHVRALQPGHLLDEDLAAAGFPLLGGRLDYLQGRSVAVLVYSRGKHLIELFVWPAAAGAGEPARAARDGYNVVHWTADGMSFSAVSDLESAGLEEFVGDWRRAR
jgi:anti-sigma factor RsiW